MSETASYFPRDITITENMLTVDTQVDLRIVSLSDPRSSSAIPVVIVPGLATIIESLKDIITSLLIHHPVIYIETREKSSSVIKGKAGFAIEDFSRDVVSIIDQLGLHENNYALLGYSFGATLISHCFRDLRAKPLCMINMEPTPVFRYPKWSLPVFRYGLQLHRMIIAVAKWYLKSFHINTFEDPEMAVISFRAIDNADPRKLRDAILGIAGYEVWQRLPDIDRPSMIVIASKDGLHNEEDILRMRRSISDSSYLDLLTNKRTHSPEMAEAVTGFIKKITTMKQKVGNPILGFDLS
jgi:pimeloyl-ACP methyl ester carboxylesterase